MSKHGSGRHRIIPLALVCLLSGGLTLPGAAHAEFPDRPITLVVGFAPGGGTDLVARTIARQLTKELNNLPVVVENKAGAGGTIAAGIVKRSAPDGYTLLVADPSFAINTGLMPNVGYDIKKDFVAVTTITRSPLVLSANKSVPVANMSQLVALAKTEPGALSISTPGVGSMPHMSVELLKRQLGIDMLHVPFKGANPAMAGVIAGSVQLTMSSVSSSLGFIQQGQVRAIATTGAERSERFRDLPTVSETVKGFNAYFWTALMAPAGTPTPVIEKLSKLMGKAMADEGAKTAIYQAGDAFAYQSPARSSEFVLGEASRWSKLIADAQIKPE